MDIFPLSLRHECRVAKATTLFYFRKQLCSHLPAYGVRDGIYQLKFLDCLVVINRQHIRDTKSARFIQFFAADTSYNSRTDLLSRMHSGTSNTAKCSRD